MFNWSIEFGKFNITYKLRPIIKASVLDNFIVECIISSNEARDD